MKKEQELEIITTAYFLEERMKELNDGKTKLRNDKPQNPIMPREPQEETEILSPIPYPVITPEKSVIPIIPESCKRILHMALVVLALSFIVSIFIPAIGMPCSTIAFWGGIIYIFRGRKAEKKRLDNESIERQKNSSAYKQACQEIDKQNRIRQAQKDEELHNKYLKKYENYKNAMKQYEVELKEYQQQELPEWENENAALSVTLDETKSALQEIYNKNVIPAPYRKREALCYLATFLNSSQYDLKFAIENFNQYVTQCKQDMQISLQEAQLRIMRETLSQQQYSNWLNEQILYINEQGNSTLNSIHNWQKADITYRTYVSVKNQRTKKKAAKSRR